MTCNGAIYDMMSMNHITFPASMRASHRRQPVSKNLISLLCQGARVLQDLTVALHCQPLCSNALFRTLTCDLCPDLGLLLSAVGCCCPDTALIEHMLVA